MNKNLIKALTSRGYSFKSVAMTNGKSGVMIDTNYDGPYPTQETRAKINEIESIVKRYKNYTTQERGFSTAVLVVEI